MGEQPRLRLTLGISGTPDFGQEERPVHLGPQEGSTGQTMVLSWGGGGQHRTTQVYTQVERLTRPDLKKNKYFPVSMVIFIPYSSSKCRTTPNAMERPILKYMTYMTEG